MYSLFGLSRIDGGANREINLIQMQNQSRRVYIGPAYRQLANSTPYALPVPSPGTPEGCGCQKKGRQVRMSLISGPASTPPASAAGCLRTVAALLFLLQVPPAAAAASSGQLSEAQHPLPPSLSRIALAASRLGGARDSGSDRTEPGRRDSSGQGTAPGRPTLYDERSNRLRPRRLASSASSGSSSSDPGSAGFDGCSEELLSCTQDRTCLSCVDGETVNVAECWEKYHPPEESDLGGGQLSFCQSLGGSYCCGAYEMYYSESAVVCVEDEAALAYWVRAGDPVFLLRYFEVRRQIFVQLIGNITAFEEPGATFSETCGVRWGFDACGERK